MSFFNDKQKEALLSGNYYCSQCGNLMEFEDEWEDTLVCPNPECGHSVDSDRYGCEDDDEYERLYPTLEEVLGIADEEDNEEDHPEGETYDEVYGELED